MLASSLSPLSLSLSLRIASLLYSTLLFSSSLLSSFPFHSIPLLLFHFPSLSYRISATRIGANIFIATLKAFNLPYYSYPIESVFPARAGRAHNQRNFRASGTKWCTFALHVYEHVCMFLWRTSFGDHN